MTIPSFWQKLFKALLSKEAFASMESESRQWMVQCQNCKYERSVWEMGGIRWKAAGNQRALRICQNCDQKGWHRIYKKVE